MLKGGVSLALGTVASIESFEETLQSLYAYYPLFEKFRDRVLHAKSIADVRRAKAEGKVAVLFHFQGSGMLDYELGRLALFKELGVGVIQLAYNWKFLVGDGCTERTDCGLTDFGRLVVKEMNRLGIVVDCSHTGYRTTLEAIELSEDPVALPTRTPGLYARASATSRTIRSKPWRQRRRRRSQRVSRVSHSRAARRRFRLFSITSTTSPAGWVRSTWASAWTSP